MYRRNIDKTTVFKHETPCTYSPDGNTAKSADDTQPSFGNNINLESIEK